MISNQCNSQFVVTDGESTFPVTCHNLYISQRRETSSSALRPVANSYYNIY